VGSLSMCFPEKVGSGCLMLKNSTLSFGSWFWFVISWVCVVCELFAHVSGVRLKKVVVLVDLFVALLVLVRLCCLLMICGFTFILSCERGGLFVL